VRDERGQRAVHAHHGHHDEQRILDGEHEHRELRRAPAKRVHRDPALFRHKVVEVDNDGVQLVGCAPVLLSRRAERNASRCIAGSPSGSMWAISMELHIS
jgi:hypothetical protein